MWRDQQIMELSALPQRTPQQEEQLRALQLERDFQKRAEEAANQLDDEDEDEDVGVNKNQGLDTELEEQQAVERVQGLLRVASATHQQQTVSKFEKKN